MRIGKIILGRVGDAGISTRPAGVSPYLPPPTPLSRPRDSSLQIAPNGVEGYRACANVRTTEIPAKRLELCAVLTQCPGHKNSSTSSSRKFDPLIAGDCETAEAYKSADGPSGGCRLRVRFGVCCDVMAFLFADWQQQYSPSWIQEYVPRKNRDGDGCAPKQLLILDLKQLAEFERSTHAKSSQCLRYPPQPVQYGGMLPERGMLTCGVQIHPGNMQREVWPDHLELSRAHGPTSIPSGLDEHPIW